MAGFGLKMEGDWSKFGKALERIARINYQKMHEQIGEALVANAQLRFEDQVDPDGIPWEKGQKRQGQTLTQKALLSASITKRATPKQVEVGTNSVYGRIHQFGGTIKAKRKKFLKFQTDQGWVQKKSVVIPKRPFIGFGKDDVADIERIFDKTMKGAAK